MRNFATLRLYCVSQNQLKTNKKSFKGKSKSKKNREPKSRGLEREHLLAF